MSGSSAGASTGGLTGGGSMLGSRSINGRFGSSGGTTGLVGIFGNGGCGSLPGIGMCGVGIAAVK
jgi:hypothetical protein